ncbi:uncharacterized protein LOC131938435 isoform X2 [Physella acuta]|uniref:uncharacterized protein LOC131938435 isoform X2 n=1 Tax=Physella acuta TaxID=109671 RepID=UPI0027DE035A|nr:uncharacterized protein LOC131938435 isoform X2 [Physella acuta]
MMYKLLLTLVVVVTVADCYSIHARGRFMEARERGEQMGYRRRSRFDSDDEDRPRYRGPVRDPIRVASSSESESSEESDEAGSRGMGMMGRRNRGWMMSRVTPSVNTIGESGTEFIEQAGEDNPTTTVVVDEAIEQQAMQANRPPRRTQA